MVVREGSNVTLKCAATGSPTPNITWRREGGERIMLHGGSDGEPLQNGNKPAISLNDFGIKTKIASKRNSFASEKFPFEVFIKIGKSIKFKLFFAVE